MSAINGAGGQLSRMSSAADLSALRDRDAAYQQAYDQVCQQAELTCVCGERIRDRGVQVIGIDDAVGLVQGPEGPQLGVKATRHTFCSRDCEAFRLRMERDQPGWDQLPPAVAVRDMPAVMWLDETEEPSGDSAA